MRMKTFFQALCLAAALIPFAPFHVRTGGSLRPSAEWPVSYNGKNLVPAELTGREKQFVKGFPGEIAKFYDGEREYLFRRVGSPTRMLHPGAHCYKGSGYDVSPRPPLIDKNGAVWGCFFAEKKGGRRFLVREQISDTSGKTWADVSAWYWSAVIGRTKGPWQAVTIAEPCRAGQ